MNSRKNPAELNQSVYFKDVLNSEWKSEYVLHCRRDFASVSIGKKAMDTSKMEWIRFEQERPPN